MTVSTFPLSALARRPEIARSEPPRSQRIWILEEHQLFRELLSGYLKAFPHLQIIGSSASEEPLLAAIATEKIDVVIMELNLRGTGGIGVLQHLAKTPGAPMAVILSAIVTEHSVSLAVRHGARAYIDKAAPLEQLVPALEEVARGELYFSDAARQLLVALASRRGRIENDAVTLRETEVLARFAQGSAVKEVASEIGLSKWAVYRIRNELRRKLALRDDKELANYALRIGLAGTVKRS